MARTLKCAAQASCAWTARCCRQAYRTCSLPRLFGEATPRIASGATDRKEEPPDATRISILEAGARRSCVRASSHSFTRQAGSGGGLRQTYSSPSSRWHSPERPWERFSSACHDRVCAAADRGDAEGLQGALPHPPARRALPEAGVALRRTSGRPGDTPDKGCAHLRTLGELADGPSITIRYGKGERFRGPYAIGTRLQREDAALLLKLVKSRGPTQRLFADVTSLRDQLRRVNPAAALPSIRKGAARYLAANGVSEADLMRITGHTRADTLKRYLGYGLQPTKEAVATQESAAQVLLGLTS
ncbi:hypothetical protein LSCM1_03729 [Leishmania martiniquensis]|uniref:TATE DNA Transposon n=1 Tax=Leishmania martiniquensis TaxID=1580590 RepID=A0A836H8H8_9TRYP|nr:hypothetical protein LSCM1_03729 [Leishmania martiniquensis]